jgi:hypothetical protein
VETSAAFARVRTAVQFGAREIQAAGFIAENPDVAIAVEGHRWAWKPSNVRILLVAESHVYTSADDMRLRVQTGSLPLEARHAPAEFVRLVYCLGYGETWLLNAKPQLANSGTWQFWNLFGRIAGTGRQPTQTAGRSARLAWKLATLRRLQERGVWLLDSSLHGIYAPGAKRVPLALTVALHRLWWEHYGSWLFEQFPGTHRCIIGKTTADRLTGIGCPWDNWIYQPQAERNVSKEQFEHGWTELLKAVGRA